MLTKFADQLEPEWEFDPLLENVAFGSTMFDFAFTLNDFASLFAPKFHVPKHKVISKLWGDKFFDAETQRWTQTPLSQSGKACKHGFTHFVMTPIFTLFRLIQDRHIYPSDRLEKALQRIDIQLSQEEALLESKSLTTLVMRKFLPISRALMNMITTHVTFKPKNSRKFMFHNLRNETTKLQQLSDINIVTLRNSER
ncbi:hypothetical protein C9374_012738 [Naegleria lovaniensis]|uniref:Uncharacterized protein n=1 Tax=Naegleria lovaniensis TaxID=51637 RepID=A0AA88H406_NAELO|nr:uncharacterized protein C9374_012738 [Naegleria lovaniensis]KAG2392486.1 hypothetical protein C9374_012738 [Naegleria lovaniensis]